MTVMTGSAAESLSDDTEEVEGTEEGTEGQEGTGTESGTEEDGYTPPTAEEWRRAQRELKRRADQLARLKKETPPKTDEDELKAAARAEVMSQLKPRLVKQAAASELVKLGYKGTDVSRIVRLLDMDDIELEDDSDELIGLSSQLDDIKADFPDLFDNRKVKNDKRLSKDASDREAPPKKQTDVDLITAALLGK